jgi:hypothetical protein
MKKGRSFLRRLSGYAGQAIMIAFSTLWAYWGTAEMYHEGWWEGPGWNWRQPWGGYPSWQSIALYGVPPVGLGDKSGYGRQKDATIYASAQEMASTNLCRYLGADGLMLMDEPQDVWRVPTADEVVRSLVRDGENAGCRWAGEPPAEAECDVLPDKESPLWATDHAAIYYWTAGQESDAFGIYVPYNGWVNATYKTGGNPRHS